MSFQIGLDRTTPPLTILPERARWTPEDAPAEVDLRISQSALRPILAPPLFLFYFTRGSEYRAKEGRPVSRRKNTEGRGEK